MPMDDELEQMVTALQQTGRYEVLRRFEPRRRYAEPDGLTRTAVAVDVETTGLDCSRDHIIQFCSVPFTYSLNTGQVFDVGPPATQLQDPGQALRPEIKALTGLTDDRLRGQRLDEVRITRLISDASLVIAHNARFDRCFLEARLPVFRDKTWACSLSDVSWPVGVGSTKLEFLLYKHCGVFFAAHSAEADCLALVHLLATPFEDGRRPLALLLSNLQRVMWRIWATQAPYEKKELLKGRHYRWHPGDAVRPKAWYIEIAEADGPAELEWLRERVYAGRSGQWQVETLRLDQGRAQSLRERELHS
jgi:DNA polymerase-3 subunit epsilon